jgi:hypothetical protein
MTIRFPRRMVGRFTFQLLRVWIGESRLIPREPLGLFNRCRKIQTQCRKIHSINYASEWPNDEDKFCIFCAQCEPV